MALPLDVITVAESLKTAGYQTGYVGKWHLGRSDAFGPAHQGYDFAAEINGPHLPGKFRVAGRNDLKPKPDQFRTDFEAELCERFIRDNRDAPFFLMLSPYVVHIRRYDYNEAADDNVATQAPLKGEKGSLHEGGIRVPLIVRYPGVVKPGSICAEPAISHDFYPTFVDAARGSLPTSQTIDGLSLMSLLAKPATRLKRDALHWHYPHYHHDRPASAIRAGDWKLIEYLDGTGDIELYDLKADLGETKNLRDERKGKVADLQGKLRSWRTRVLARMPIMNPSYDAKRAEEWWSRRSGKRIESHKRKRFPQSENNL
jgi:arylsulfatase A-like enzyme